MLWLLTIYVYIDPGKEIYECRIVTIFLPVYKEMVRNGRWFNRYTYDMKWPLILQRKCKKWSVVKIKI